MSRYESSSERKSDRESIESHFDAKDNFEIWNKIYRGRDFRIKLEGKRVDVKEFFRFRDTEVFYHRFRPSFFDIHGNQYPPEDDQGVSCPIPGNPDHRKMPEWYGYANPLCIQLSFKNKKGNHSTNLLLQQSTDEFKKDCSFLLNIDWQKNDPTAWK